MTPGEEEQQDELEVTGEGTAGGPFGLKKVLFVRKKSEKGVAPKEVKTFHPLLIPTYIVDYYRCFSPCPARPAVVECRV